MLWSDSTPGPPGCGVELRRARRPRLRRALRLLGWIGVRGTGVSGSVGMLHAPMREGLALFQFDKRNRSRGDAGATKPVLSARNNLPINSGLRNRLIPVTLQQLFAVGC